MGIIRVRSVIGKKTATTAASSEQSATGARKERLLHVRVVVHGLENAAAAAAAGGAGAQVQSQASRAQSRGTARELFARAYLFCGEASAVV